MGGEVILWWGLKPKMDSNAHEMFLDLLNKF